MALPLELLSVHLHENIRDELLKLSTLLGLTPLGSTPTRVPQISVNIDLKYNLPFFFFKHLSYFLPKWGAYLCPWGTMKFDTNKFSGNTE